MKFNFKYLLVVLLFLAAVPVFAFAQEVPDVTDPSNLVLLVMPAITWLAVEIVKRVKSGLGSSIAGGWILGLIVPGLSALGAWLLTLIVPDASFLTALLLGLGSTFIDQLIKKFKEE